jgi:hypothetical protein
MGRSCGGCCANFDKPKDVLEKVFFDRNKAYEAWVRSEDDLLLFRKKMDLLERGYRQCRFLAFLGEGNKRVGCLLHPRRPENKGRDLRDYGFYEDCGFCASNFCGSSKHLLRKDIIDKQFFLLIQEDLDWYEYSRLFSFYVDLNGTKGMLDIYVEFTRPLYESIFERLPWRELQGKGFLQQYHRLIRRVVKKLRGTAYRLGSDDDILFQGISEALGAKGRPNIVDGEVDEFIRDLDVCSGRLGSNL